MLFNCKRRSARAWHLENEWIPSAIVTSRGLSSSLGDFLFGEGANSCSCNIWFSTLVDWTKAGAIAELDLFLKILSSCPSKQLSLWFVDGLSWKSFLNTVEVQGSTFPRTEWIIFFDEFRSSFWRTLSMGQVDRKLLYNVDLLRFNAYREWNSLKLSNDQTFYHKIQRTNILLMQS